jgi:glycosyltransferase involved in cell wall biosynthesis
MLLKLIKHMDNSLFCNEVISLSNLGLIGRELCSFGVSVNALGMRPHPSSLFKILKLFLLVLRSKPDIVQTWMYHSDLLGGIVARLCGIDKICWNIRHCNLDIDKNKTSTLIVVRLCSILSSILPSKIICNSITGMQNHTLFGYYSGNFCVIPNGFETNKFFPNLEIRRQTRASLKITDCKFLFGNVGRFNKQKNHHDLLSAFALILDKNPNSVLVCCGNDVTLENKVISEQVQKLNISSNVILLGYRNDTPNLYNAFDAYVSSSLGEGFSNSIGEAMSSSVPCIVTNVGDSKSIVGNTGWTVDAGCSVKLAEGMSKAVSMSLTDLSRKGFFARQRVLKSFSIKSIVQSFEHFYLKLLA